MKTEISTYEQQALDFLAKTNTTFSAEFVKHGKHFDNDKGTRDIYSITLSRGSRKFTFDFGQSINKSGFYYTRGVNSIPLDYKWIKYPKHKLKYLIKQEIDYSFISNLDKVHYPEAPNAYSVLACLTKYDPGTFEDFCSEFGYDTDSKKAEKTYNSVVNEWNNIKALFNDAEIEELQEIQ